MYSIDIPEQLRDALAGSKNKGFGFWRQVVFLKPGHTGNITI
jgi:hypothetical protein